MGKKTPKSKFLKKKMFFRLNVFFWMNAQEPIFVQLYSYTAQNICSEVLSKVLKTNLFEIKNKNFRPKKNHPPPPPNCNNLGGGVKSQLAILTRFDHYWSAYKCVLEKKTICKKINFSKYFFFKSTFASACVPFFHDIIKI